MYMTGDRLCVNTSSFKMHNFGQKKKSRTSIGSVNISQRVVFWLSLFCFSGVFDPGEGRGGAGLFGIEPLTEGFFIN